MTCIALLLAAVGDDQRVIEVIKELDMIDAPDEYGVGKAWDGIHRYLTEGRFGSEDGSYPLNAVVLGGLPPHRGQLRRQLRHAGGGRRGRRHARRP